MSGREFSPMTVPPGTVEIDATHLVDRRLIMFLDGKPLSYGERLQLMRTIEGEGECTPDIHDFVSNLRPRPEDSEPVKPEPEAVPA